MCICAAEIKVCTDAGRVRARLALDASKRTRRPCYAVFTSFSQTTPVRYHLMYVGYERKWPSAWYVQGKSQTVSPRLTQSSTFLPGTYCKLLTAKPLQRNTQCRPPREMFGCDGNSKCVNMHTLIAEGQYARLMQKSMLRRYIVCSWHHW